MTATDGASQPPRNRSPFQLHCASEVAKLLREKGLSFRREPIEGNEESYFIFRMDSSTVEPLEIYVYEDEAGFLVGKDWHIWESPDYETPQELISAFLKSLRSSIEDALDESPAVS